MMRAPAILFASLWLLAAQQKPPARLSPKPLTAAAREQADLETALSEAGGNPIEYLRAIEKHLAKYPDSPRRPELERAAARAAIESNDNPKIILYGERVLARQPGDLQFLDRVTLALLASGSPDAAQRALKYAQRYEELTTQMRGDPAHSGRSAADWRNEADRGIGMALRYEARATGNLGHVEPALALAQRSFETWPDAEAAREEARWLERLGRLEDAARALADAFTIPDPHATDADRERDRARMGELYVKAKGSQTGLGDLVLQAYDRNTALLHARELRTRAGDPNAHLTDPMQFTLSGLDGSQLSMASVKGKVTVLDFWATWCVPCRAQHPLYEQVKERFRDNSAVVFLSIDTDEDRQLVEPFLAEVNWADAVYFEDGLARALDIGSLPTTIVIDRTGRISSRMNGYLPERFVEMLVERVNEALGK